MIYIAENLDLSLLDMSKKPKFEISTVQASDVPMGVFSLVKSEETALLYSKDLKYHVPVTAVDEVKINKKDTVYIGSIMGPDDIKWMKIYIK